MIFAKGKLLPDDRRPQVLAGLEEQINLVRSGAPLQRETVIAAVDRLGKRLRTGEFDLMLRQFLPQNTGEALEVLRPLLSRSTLERKCAVELGEEPSPGEQTIPRRLPLGTLLHVAAGNLPGLPVYSVLEGLLTGNVNLLKLPRADKGLSLAALQLLTEEEPALAEYIWAFDLPSSETEDIRTLASLADGVVVWGGDSAVASLRALAPPGAKLMEWGHRLSFAYVAGYENREAELAALAEHIMHTNQRLCSSCQVIFLDTEDVSEVTAFCQAFLPYLEGAAATVHTGVDGGAQASLSGLSALLERVVEGRARGEQLFRGRGCSLIARPDRELELSPMEGNVLVKALPRRELLATLRRQKGRLQTAGLLCRPEERGELAGLLARAGVNRVTRAGDLSAAFPGEGHDGEYPLRRYTRVVEIQR